MINHNVCASCGQPLPAHVDVRRLWCDCWAHKQCQKQNNSFCITHGHQEDNLGGADTQWEIVLA